MGLGDIKIEADKLGYRLVRKTEYVHFMPCICGASNRGRWSSPDGIFFECNNCGLKSKPAKNETDARKNWNKLVEGYVKEPEEVEAPYGRKEKQND
jgi:hypothetical protein